MAVAESAVTVPTVFLGNPVPVTTTSVPMGPEFGDSVITAAERVAAAEAGCAPRPAPALAINATSMIPAATVLNSHENAPMKAPH